MRGVPLLEQPRSSLLESHPMFQWLIRTLSRKGIKAPLLQFMLSSSTSCAPSVAEETQALLLVFSFLGVETGAVDETPWAYESEADFTLVRREVHSALLSGEDYERHACVREARGHPVSTKQENDATRDPSI